MSKLTVTLPALHRVQQAIDASPARFRVVAAGRRLGKTEYGVDWCTRVALGGGLAWWVAPTYPVASIGWSVARWIAAQIPGAVVREAERAIQYPGGGALHAKSAHDPDSLRGKGLDALVMDEAAYIPERAWSEVLRASLSDTLGRALFISTPAGRNWFYRLYGKGLQGDPDWESFQFPTSDNPFIDAAEIEAARRDLPERIFRQEYLAEFIDDAGGVFRNVRACIADWPETEPLPGARYVMGVDWAQQHDFTALLVLNADSGQVVALDRFNQIEWAVQRARLETLARRWNVTSIVAEHNSIGGPNIEALQSAGLPVAGFVTTSKSKQRIIQALALALEQQAIGLIDDPVMLNELQAYESRRLTSGAWAYDAPQGLHDDTVIALALAWEAANTRPPVLEAFTTNPFY